jgi:hypothetical protein
VTHTRVTEHVSLTENVDQGVCDTQHTRQHAGRVTALELELWCHRFAQIPDLGRRVGVGDHNLQWGVKREPRCKPTRQRDGGIEKHYFRMFLRKPTIMPVRIESNRVDLIICSVKMKPVARYHHELISLTEQQADDYTCVPTSGFQARPVARELWCVESRNESTVR